MAVACGGPATNVPKARLTPKDIVKESSPAIVRIEAGEAKVGTGFVVDKAGIVATNLHVIEGETQIKVRTFDGTQYPVMSIAGMDRGHDLALLRINPKKPMPTLSLGDSSQVSAGDQIIAIGNPLGVFDYSVSAGLISQVRPLSEDLTILQISAPISPGSSGGPLFNQFGEVIGVTTAIITQGQNINLAVPANYLRPMLAQRTSMKLDDFAKLTKEAEVEEKPHTDADLDPKTGKLDTSVPPRHVPEHELTVWDGCSADQIEDTVKAIVSTIEIGAPAYNRSLKENTPDGFEECFHIYNRTALKLESSGACKGVRTAFGDGLLRVDGVKSFKDKAWALRDTFDGLTNAAAQWCMKDATCRKTGFKSIK
jgi:V8-like Glu-specific endopeptidase